MIALRCCNRRNLSNRCGDRRTKWVDLLHTLFGGKHKNTAVKVGPQFVEIPRFYAVLAAIFIIGFLPGYSQQIAPLLQPPDQLFGKGIEFGVDKITNTFVWVGNADITIPSDLGDFRVFNSYRASAFRTVTTATRDDENFQLSWERRLVPDVTAVVRQGYVLSRDSRSVGLNSLERLGIAGGVRFGALETSNIEALIGVESSSQLGVRALGPLAGVRALLRDVDIELWQLSGAAYADWQLIDAQRTNTDVDLRADVIRPLAEGSVAQITLQAVNLGREFFTNVSAGSQLDVEQRNEQRIIVGGSVGYAIIPELRVSLTTSLTAGAVDRGYRTAIPAIPLSAVERQLRELILDVEASAEVRQTSWSILGGGAVFSRNEQNGVVNRHGLNQGDLDAIRAQEFQRDNATFRSKLFGRGEWFPSAHDTVRFDVSGWLLRYNTPSASNDDDRDELATVATLGYARRISPVLSFNVALSGQYLHLVFLKSTRSALNNVNRVLRLSPSVHITGSVVRMQPQLEVLANYTVYDYEGVAASVRSFSFRQVSYRDSIHVQFARSYHVESQVLLRYFERSTLLWANFSETPQTGNLEYLTKLLIFNTPSAAWSVGAGVRLYSLDQRTILAGMPQLNIGSVYSIGPETAIRFVTPGGSLLTLSGWYEFQTINQTAKRELPNLLLRAIVRI